MSVSPDESWRPRSWRTRQCKGRLGRDKARRLELLAGDADDRRVEVSVCPRALVLLLLYRPEGDRERRLPMVVFLCVYRSLGLK